MNRSAQLVTWLKPRKEERSLQKAALCTTLLHKGGMRLNRRWVLRSLRSIRIFMKKLNFNCALFFAALLIFCGCASSHKAFSPNKKYSAEQLKEDYSLFRKILEDVHPSLYWYTPKDSIDYYFDEGYKRIRDSMTEPGFRTLISYVLARIN